MESLWGKLTYLRLGCCLTLVAGGITVNTHLALERVGDLGTKRTNICEIQLSPHTGGGGGGGITVNTQLALEKAVELENTRPGAKVSALLLAVVISGCLLYLNEPQLVNLSIRPHAVP